ncbi:MAG: SusC/RagA family TonB-linked outer membrane protein [Longimicrobiales bacterium]|nr:SusC/RagA family TonB-linked outer membrane protein [Longimicrobiales bacterium]
MIQRYRMWAASLSLALAALALGPGSVRAQETGRIVGQVTAAMNMEPLEGAQVFVEGLRIGGLTNAEGRFLILNVPAGTHVVRVENLGFASATRSVTVTAGGTVTVDFTLSETALALEEIVVTGTAAEVRAREVGNSLDAITSRDIENLPVTNPENILGGRVPGLTVTQAGGQPGAGGTIRIRGQSTASQTAEPLIYIDGVRVYNLPLSGGGESRVSFSPLQDIAAEDIERIEVIKGASATTLYGTEAAGGVIQVFTKRGIAGAPIWNAEITTGISSMQSLGADDDPSELYTRCDQEMFSLSQSRSTLGEKIFFEDPTCPSSGRWFETGFQQRYSLSVRGGTENVSYFVSSNYSDANGTLPTQGSKDGGIRANIDFQPVEDFTIQLNTAYTRRSSQFVMDGNNADGFLLNVGRGTNGNFKGGKGDDCVGVTVLCVSNGYIFEGEITAVSDRYTTGMVFQYNPTESLSQRVSVGWDYLNLTSEDWIPFGFLRSPTGSFSSTTDQREKLSIDYAGSFRNNFTDEIVSTFSWGGQLFRDRYRQKDVFTEEFSGPGRPLLTSGAASPSIDDQKIGQTNAGFFLQEVLGYQDRLFFTLGLRVDGNSAFGDDFGLEYYPKASMSWILSDYDFWPTDLMDAFKLRGAVGYSGKAPGVFDKFRTWTPITEEAGAGGFTPADVGNENVGPERTREIEVGFDASFLDGRFGLETTYYRTRTSDALVPVTLPPSQGFLASSIQNVGEIEGEGLEFQVTADVIRTRAFEWRFRGNFGFNDTEAVDLSGQVIDGDLFASFREGFPVPGNFGIKVMNPDDLAEPILEQDQFLGDVNPSRTIGLGSTFILRQNLTLDVLFEHQGGHTLPNYTAYQNARRGAWFPCFPVQDALVAQFNGDPGPISQFTALERARCRMNGIGGHSADFWVEDADFWKFRQAAITYQLPQSLIANFASRASVTLSGNNLWLWTDYSGLDPEVEDFFDRGEGGIFDGTTDFGRREYYNIPAPRTFLLSLRVTF